jgi:hypothetical protein
LKKKKIKKKKIKEKKKRKQWKLVGGIYDVVVTGTKRTKESSTGR